MSVTATEKGDHAIINWGLSDEQGPAESHNDVVSLEFLIIVSRLFKRNLHVFAVCCSFIKRVSRGVRI
jgi:hypothetical protein